MIKNFIHRLFISDLRSVSIGTSKFIKMSINLGAMRKPYKEKTEAFLEEHIPVKEPIHQFKLWFDEVCQAKKVFEPNAVCLATATKDGIPSARMVLLKAYGKEGFSFYTHYDSRKGKELEENPRAALTFYWDVHERSVRIEGKVTKLDASYAENYFRVRPRASQIGALCSDNHQSLPIAGRYALIQKERELTEKYRDEKIPKPALWGGYVVVPEVVEFWQGQTDRLHDRIRFRRPQVDDKIDGKLLHEGDDGWVYERLSP